MKKKVRNIIRSLGCFALVTSILLGCACSRRRRAKETRTQHTMESGETKDTTEDTSETSESTGDTSESTGETSESTGDPTTTTTSGVQSEASKLLHELDEKLFKKDLEDMDILSLEFEVDHPENYGVDWPDVGLTPWSESDEEENKKEIEEIEKELQQINYDDLGLEDKLLYDTMMADINMAKKGFQYSEYYLPVMNSLTGIQAELPMLLPAVEIEDVETAERYIKVINDIYDYYASLVKYEKIRAEKGYSLPDKYLENIVDSCESMLKDKENSFLYSTFDEKVQKLNTDDATKARLIEDHKKALDEKFFPAYEMLIKEFKGMYGTATTSGRLCELKDGKEFYEYYFQYRSGTSLTIPEAIEVLDKKVQEAIADMNMATMQMNQSQIQKVMANDFETYSKGSFEENLDYCKEAIKKDFPTLPEHEYFIFHIPKELSEFFSPAAYMSTQIDNLSKNELIVNDYTDAQNPMLPTVAHEAYPGHLFQKVYHIANLSNHYQLDSSTAYAEGWSTYCENYIIGLTDYDQLLYRVYKDNMDVVNYYMQARIDIGVHYEGWTYDDVLKYLAPYFGDASGLAQEFYDRVIEIPCYVTPYTFGNINCTKIINDAMAANPGMDKAKIHAAYLNMGASNYDLLAKYMPLFVEQQK